MIKVYIGQRDFGMSKNIYIVRKDFNGKRYVAKTVKFEWVEHKEGEECDPTIKLDHELGDAFLKALAESLDKEGIKTENDFKIAGLLEAKKEHLEDMRKLVFAQLEFRKEL